MADWQAGDLALCVRDDTDIPPKQLQKGRIYIVTHVTVDWRGTIGLLLDGLPIRGFWLGFAEHRFRKVTPPKPTADDREVIDLMLGKKVPHHA